ncbi:HpcH/HpaI aldolase/citrate lyase family protein [Blastococcus sp. VKM Ac-2987]|uniref:HpcH/HpaI aldolase/citrate lyase family protein n=1 Tax=Blastococcus sp. VKM Ac-2987 TaxID=3004141 RepID=UPI0022AB5FAA|nr:CoA ester lyase [Blastococcus sp. VKM Ac-2987]MCZ2859110.1 CoA ester lyase [Blastococcus sp. VKM Ac-2987]
MSTAPRSWLYVPGHRDDRVAKALTAGADAVVVDLEDAVPAAQKDRARELTAALLDEHRPDGSGPRLWVRINPPGTDAGERDVATLSGRRVDGIRVPRADDPVEVRAVGDRVGVPMQLLLESARGLWRAHELAGAHELVAGIGLGEADLAADLLVDRDEGLRWARGTVVVAARAAGLPSPVQSVWTDVADLDGLRASSLVGRATGFHGRSVVHPRQLGPVHEVYTPSPEEVAAAERVVATAAEAAARGESAVLDADGRFVDPAVVARARTVLDRAPSAPSPAPSSGDPR